jgi:hypothetical protein
VPKTTSPKPQSSKNCIKLAQSNRNNSSKMLFKLDCQMFLNQNKLYFVSNSEYKVPVDGIKQTKLL